MKFTCGFPLHSSPQMIFSAQFSHPSWNAFSFMLHSFFLSLLLTWCFFFLYLITFSGFLFFPPSIVILFLFSFCTQKLFLFAFAYLLLQCSLFISFLLSPLTVFLKDSHGNWGKTSKREIVQKGFLMLTCYFIFWMKQGH